MPIYGVEIVNGVPTFTAIQEPGAGPGPQPGPPVETSPPVGGGTPPPVVVPPPVEPPPVVGGADLTIVTFTPPALQQGVASNMSVTVKNIGTQPIVAPTLIGCGFYIDDVVQAGVATNVGLAAGATITLTSDTAQYTSGRLTPTVSGSHKVSAWIDDTGVVIETSDSNNRVDVTTTIAAPVVVPPTPEPGTRFYTAASSWNTPIPANATYTNVTALSGGGGWINAGDFGTPVVRSSPSDPIVTINAPASWGWPAQQLQLRVPAAGVGATGSDGSQVIIDGNIAYDFWQFHRSGNTASCSAWAKSNIVTETGWANNHSFPAAGIHAVGSALLAGVIFGDELKNGFSHALAIALRTNITSSQFVGEAIYSDGDGGPVPEGARFGIPPSVAMPTGMSAPAQHIWHACQTYGCFVVDKADGNPTVNWWCDTITTDQADIDVLLGANFTAPDLATITHNLRRVS